MVKPKFYSAFENVSDKKYRKEKFRYQIELLKMQEWALVNDKRIAIVFEGRDAAGKGSAIKRMAENLMTKHHRVIEVGSPTPKQNRSWFHTFEKTLPKKGEIVFYDRSWYSRAMIQPTMKYCSDAQYKYFMKNVNKWEANMIKNGITLVKLYLSIDKTTQKKRFEIRKNHSLKYWKLSKNDIESLKMWDQYTYYKNEMFRKNSIKKDSLIETAYDNNVPIFCPAFTDSSAGFGLVIHQEKNPNKHITIDTIREFRELTEIKIKSKNSGLFMIGGGVPKNFIQDTVICAELLGKEVDMHKYAIQITVADSRDGACSSSTLKEASSWGKVDVTKEQMVFAEATSVLPLIASDAYHKGEWKNRARKNFTKIFE